MSQYVSAPRKHPEGWAIDVYREASHEVKLATAYGADVAEASYRAGRIASVFGLLPAAC